MVSAGTIDQLIDSFTFVSFTFYTLAITGVLILRITHRKEPRLFKVYNNNIIIRGGGGGNQFFLLFIFSQCCISCTYNLVWFPKQQVWKSLHSPTYNFKKSDCYWSCSLRLEKRQLLLLFWATERFDINMTSQPAPHVFLITTPPPPPAPSHHNYFY